MNTVSVTVEHANQAFIIADWLKNIRFVRDVKIHHNDKLSGNVYAVQQALDSIKTDCILADITDPVAYQKTIRDEWN